MDLTIEKKIGIFFMLAIITLGVMIELVEDWNPFELRLQYSVYFPSTVGLKVGDPVMMAGVEVGKVTAIVIDNNRVRTDFYVIDGTVVKEDSTASVRQTNLLGGTFLGLTFGSVAAAPLKEGGVIASRSVASLEELIDSFNRNQNETFTMVKDILTESRAPFVNLLQRLESVAEKIDSGEGTLGQLVNNEALYTDLHVTISQLREIVGGVRNGEGTVGKLMVDPALYDNINATAANLKTITDKVNSGKGTVGKLINEDKVYNDLTDALADIREIVAKTNDGKGTLGKLVNDDALYTEATAAAARANSILVKIDEGKGTIGKLVNEDGLYRKAETTLNKVDKAVGGLSDTGPMSALGTIVGTLF